MDSRDLFIALFLGMIEGLTEFIPVSSTGHMIIFDDLLFQSHLVLQSVELANTFKVVIQFGSIIAVMIIFKDRFIELIQRSLTPKEDEQQMTIIHFIISLLPAVILGLLFEPIIDTYLFRIETVIIGLLLGAILMLVADQSSQANSFPATSLEQISYKQAFYIGLYQCLALWPGFSRSGATIAGGVLLGLRHRVSADFTFMMAVPIMLGASILSLYKKWSLLDVTVVPFFIVGFISAFIFAYLSITFFLSLISKLKLKPFAIYRIVVAIVLIYMLLT